PALAAEVVRLRADNAEWEAARDAYYASEQRLAREAERMRAELAARPTRAEAYRQVADELALMQSVEPDHRHAAGLYSAE
ncbi:hypothetical protein KBZ21_42730, partial [Streptomyces sp. A73]|nr:hypothetical protein [Streptomyces sp. A73]